jgi:predicted DNA-binding protein (MmcQ/YjbR family)
MNIDSLREFCLSFAGASENLQWGEELCFKVGGKIFAMLALGSVPQSLTFKCNPETFAEVTEKEGVVPAAYVGRYQWVTVKRLDVLRDAELQDMIRQSYEMVSGKTKSVKKAAAKARRPKNLTKARRLG